jgi:hypothetical protein
MSTPTSTTKTIDDTINEQKQKCIQFYTNVFNKILNLPASSQPLPSDTQFIWNRYKNDENWSVDPDNYQIILNGYVYKNFYTDDNKIIYFTEYNPVTNQTVLMKISDNGPLLYVYTNPDVDFTTPTNWKNIQNWIDLDKYINDIIPNHVLDRSGAIKKRIEHYDKLKIQIVGSSKILDGLNKNHPE